MISCKKEVTSPASIEGQDLPPIVDSRKDYGIQDLIALADFYNKAETNRQSIGLPPADFKYALETSLNRDLRAGKNIGADQQSNPLIFDYTLNASGEIDGEQYDSFYAQIVQHVEFLEALGGLFHIIDVELVEGDRLVADVITAVGYVNTDLSFGFNPLPETGNYQVLSSPSFRDLIRSRIFVEELNEDEYFYTDIYPNPAWLPEGLDLWVSEIVGLLADGCNMHAGTTEACGGPALIYGNNNQNIWMSGSLANEYLMKGIHNIESKVPPIEGMQLIRLNFDIFENLNALYNPPCLPGSPCDACYPCFAYSHKWNKGFVARKTAIEK